MFKKLINTSLLLFFVPLVIILAFLIYNNWQLKNTLKQLNSKKEKEFNEKIKKERELIRKDLEEKHAADMVSYEAMARRMELEKKKVKELEEKLRSAGGSVQSQDRLKK